MMEPCGPQASSGLVASRTLTSMGLKFMATSSLRSDSFRCMRVCVRLCATYALFLSCLATFRMLDMAAQPCSTRACHREAQHGRQRKEGSVCVCGAESRKFKEGRGARSLRALALQSNI